MRGQKPSLIPKEVWAIRVRFQPMRKLRDLALFDVAIDSRLRSCDLVAVRVSDVTARAGIRDRAVIVQQGLAESDYLFPGRVRRCLHLPTRQSARIVSHRVAAIGPDPHQ